MIDIRCHYARAKVNAAQVQGNGIFLILNEIISDLCRGLRLHRVLTVIDNEIRLDRVFIYIFIYAIVGYAGCCRKYVPRISKLLYNISVV